MVKKSSFLEKLFARKKTEDRVEPVSRDRVPPASRMPAGNVPATGRFGDKADAPAMPTPQRATRIIPAPESKKPEVATSLDSKAATKPTDKSVEGQKPASTSDSLAVQSAAEAEKPAIEPAVLPPASAKSAAPAAKPRVEPKPLVIDAPRSTASGISRVLGTKSREDAAMALTDGFRELGSLLQGIHRRMDDQSRQATSLNDKFVGLPDMAKAQVDFMAKVSQQLVDQREKTGELLDKLSGLPALLDGIHKTLERQAAVEERTEKNLRDFRSTMDRIHNSIGELQSQSQAAMTKATETFERTNGRTTRVFEETQKQAYETFQKSQEQGLAQLAKIVEKSGKASRGVTIMMVLLLLSVAALTIVVLANK